jgi:hypothetical protein
MMAELSGPRPQEAIERAHAKSLALDRSVLNPVAVAQGRSSSGLGSSSEGVLWQWAVTGKWCAPMRAAARSSQLGESAGREAEGAMIGLRAGQAGGAGGPLVAANGVRHSCSRALTSRTERSRVERTLEQDAAFGIRQLVDLACKALSPAANAGIAAHVFRLRDRVGGAHEDMVVLGSCPDDPVARRAVGTRGREVDVVGGLEKLPHVLGERNCRAVSS